MDPKLFATTFALVFVAELGDKTQLATLTLATTGSRLTVFAAAALALVLTSALAVVGADLVARHVPAAWLARGAGVMFIALGAWQLWKA